MKTTILDEYLKDEEFRRLFAQEDLILEVTETLCELLEKEKISRKELADRLGKTKGFVSQLLNGGRNLTLRTVADILHVLGYRGALKPFKEGEQRQESNVTQLRTLYTPPKSFVVTRESFEIPFADGYFSKAAIVN
ncbi:MAG: helix-turn-helix transcriptional regulator [Deltaproteobacteria bacterium]|nr:helix-turn-helix transcriptional regulator [Deltaproteobacteria bacterium]